MNTSERAHQHCLRYSAQLHPFDGIGAIGIEDQEPVARPGQNPRPCVREMPNPARYLLACRIPLLIFRPLDQWPLLATLVNELGNANESVFGEVMQNP